MRICEVFLPKSSPPLLAVAGQSVLDDRIRFLRRLDLVDLHSLAFELLVVLEEPAEHRQPVRGHLAGFAVTVEAGSSVATAMILWSFLPASIMVINPIVRA